jgi:hypothetical protein
VQGPTAKLQARIVLRQLGRGLMVRTLAGHAVRILKVNLRSAIETESFASVDVSADFTPVQQMIAGMVERRHPVLGDEAFKPETALNAVFADLSMTPLLDWRFDALPPATVDKDLDGILRKQFVTLRASGGLASLYRHCDQCHSGEQVFPPGFLRGTERQVLDQVKACVPRMLRRLSMWQQVPSLRSKSPMPPEHALRALGHEPVDWINSAGGRELLEFLRRLAPTARGDPEADYAALPQCVTARNTSANG